MNLDVDIAVRLGAFSLQARFTAPGDGITVLFGPSGSGKSTLLSVLAGLRRPDRGRIALGQAAIDGRAPHRREIGLVFQDARLFPHLNVRQNLQYAWRRAPQERRLGIEEVAGFFDIVSLLDRPTGYLSGGEKSRVALARALISRPRFLLLDEPFAALDGVRRRAFIQVLLRMHRIYQLPMLIVTHNIDDAAALGSHLVAIRNGTVAVSGDFIAASGNPEFSLLLDARDTGAAVSAGVLRATHEDGGRAVWLRADQVLLAAEHPLAISARNILAGEVHGIQMESASSCLVTLATSVGVIRSRVTPQAVEELCLAPGRPAWALVKAHSL